jgi:hypothetical protein
MITIVITITILALQSMEGRIGVLESRLNEMKKQPSTDVVV